jgi:two-component system phosphate regulon sensor histidine kinase PhoR
MKNKNLRIVILLALLSIIGIIITQTYWFKRAFDLKEKQFNHNVTVALQNTAEELIAHTRMPIPLESLVTELSGNYYVVQLNAEISTEMLEFLLKKEFEKRNILVDFEYGIYNCESKKMVYGNYISFGTPKTGIKRKEFPVWKDESYYFAVYFPNKTGDLINQMGILLFISIVLLVVCLFFGYTILVILKQKRLSDIQKDFINNMTHEFKTPISTIQITTDLLKRQKVNQNPELIQNYTSIIHFEASRLKEHVDRVLQVAILDKEKIKYNFTETDLHQCITNAVKSVTIALEIKKGSIITKLNAQKSIIYADAAHITNVIFNLLDNAIKYTKTNPLIEVETENNEKYVAVKIRDNGIGIPKQNIRKIFDKFYRVPTGNIHDVKGFGLGLYYVSSMVKIHKGKIHVNSEVGKGSEFKVLLHLIKKNNESAT